VQIRLMDPSAVMHAGLVRHVREVAEERKIAHQVAVRKSGGTDARAIQLHASGVPTVVLGVPARYVHTHNSVIHIGDYLSALELVLELVQSLDAATVDRLCAFEA
ncbi:MAG: M20/M25/M40 family metallo-hydrolase, partial [Syntrophobacteraceae bacterium]|nr:M20/M25/M40 family metallo-hydrolase [Desulfobacteraceae bacterium]